MTATIWPRMSTSSGGSQSTSRHPASSASRSRFTRRTSSRSSCSAPTAALIDTGMGVADIAAVVRSLTDLPVIVTSNHAHWDHIGGNELFDEIWIHEAEAEGRQRRVERYPAAVVLAGPAARTLPEGFRAEAVSYPPTPPTGTFTGGEKVDLGDRTWRSYGRPFAGGIALWDEVTGSSSPPLPTRARSACIVGRTFQLPAHLRTADRLNPQPVAVFGSHCDVEMPVEMLAAQRDAIAAITGGLEPTRELPGDVLRWEFDGFALELG